MHTKVLVVASNYFALPINRASRCGMPSTALAAAAQAVLDAVAASIHAFAADKASAQVH